MNHRTKIRTSIVELLKQAETTIPSRLIKRLPPSEELLGEPEWHRFEHSLWDIGESIRQQFMKYPALRKNQQLQDGIVAIATDRRAHRGRQSFVILLGYKTCAGHAERIAKELDDPCVDGHVISTLYLMKASGFSDIVKPFIEHDRAWIRKEAKRYVSWDSGEKRKGLHHPINESSCTQHQKIEQATIRTTPKVEWYRRETWTEEDARDFEMRLKRAHKRNRPEYIRIQAGHLSGTGDPILQRIAISLLDRVLDEYPDVIWLSLIHLLRGDCYYALHDIPHAVECYRQALSSQRTIPNLNTGAWLKFSKLVIEEQLHELYEECVTVVHEFSNRKLFTAQHFMFHAVLAIFADSQGDLLTAQSEAKRAMEAARSDHSGLRYHPNLGIVNNEHEGIQDRLDAILKRSL